MISGRRALLESLLILLRAAEPQGMGKQDSECDIASGGRPPVASGDWFYGLHGSTPQSTARTSFIEYPVVKITISARAHVPADLLGSALIEAVDGMSDRLDEMRAFIARQQHEWMNIAWALLQKSAGGQVDRPVTPAFDMREEDAREVGPDWWRAPPPPRTETTPAPAGVITTLTVSGFKFEQYHESAQ